MFFKVYKNALETVYLQMIEQSNFAFEWILENTVFMQKDCFSSSLILVFQSLQKRRTKNVGLLDFEKVVKTSVKGEWARQRIFHFVFRAYSFYTYIASLLNFKIMGRKKGVTGLNFAPELWFWMFLTCFLKPFSSAF